ncbi:MAG: L,D-transpeptidase [Woeseia sp.]|nr:L,D-transpeptidase [Woeseia sp.]MBT8095782.1 L,D-transpeptidase [Woeseia sp.]NNE61768.1 L,D-transpeptidase [Woeseia sp.]NNL54181.1 L,D-transpeptidase [Woeseia sp.]
MPRILFLSALLLSVPVFAGTGGRAPAGLLQVPSGVDTILVAETATATLRQFAVRGDHIEQTDTTYMSIGRNGAGKQRAWDRKTPLGIYFILEELDTDRLHDKYGDKAFVLDYPNAWDRYRERTGDGIWLHGVDKRDPDRPPRDTDGCLALPNERINALAADLAPLTTPVIVVRELAWTAAEAARQQRAQLLDALERWKVSVEQGNLTAYLALYADDFKYRDMAHDEWAQWRSQVFAKRNIVALEVQGVALIADPEEEGLFLSRFTQRMQTVENTVEITKRLYWRYDNAGNLRIVTEGSG